MNCHKLVVIMTFILLIENSYSQNVIRCADPECSICLAVPGAVSPEKSDTREPRNPPEDTMFGRSGSLTVVNPILRSPHQATISLAGNWEFCVDSASDGVKERWMQPESEWPSIIMMPVPSNWESHGVGEPALSTPWKKGSVFHEKWAFLVYETDGSVPYAPVLEWEKRLKNPLRLRLEEEVDERVSRSLVEIYMDEGKSGWEERETGNHK
jgi:hypothetical protein